MNKKTILIIAGLVLAAALVIGGLFLVKNNKNNEHEDLPTSMSEHGVLVGKEDAPLKVVAWADYQCPFCATLNSAYGDAFKSLIKDGEVSVEYRAAHFLDRGEEDGISIRSARAALVAQDMGYFTQFHDTLYANQKKLSGKEIRDAIPDLIGMSDEEKKQFAEKIDAKEHDDIAQKAHNEFMNAGLQSVPTYEVNGKKVVFTDETGKPVIDTNPNSLLKGLKETAEQ